jgi:hypothetical protein
MSQRMALFGLIGVLGLAAWSAAAPPVNPIVEGRETDPVSRDYHQENLVIGAYVPPPGASDESSQAGWLALAGMIWDVMLDQLTVPLGAAVALPSCNTGSL